MQCRAVAGLSNTGADGSASFRTMVNYFLGRWQGDFFRLGQLAFPLSFCFSALLNEDSGFVDFATPGSSCSKVD